MKDLDAQLIPLMAAVGAIDGTGQLKKACFEFRENVFDVLDAMPLEKQEELAELLDKYTVILKCSIAKKAG